MTTSKHTHIWDFVKKWYPDYDNSVDIKRAAELKDMINKDDPPFITEEYYNELERGTTEYWSLCTRIYEESILAHHAWVAEEQKRAEEMPWY